MNVLQEPSDVQRHENLHVKAINAAITNKRPFTFISDKQTYFTHNLPVWQPYPRTVQ